MCTTGAKIFSPGQEFVLFKNRDFTREHFEDTFDHDAGQLGVLGVETWDNDGTQEDHLSGFSIGFNQHLACCDSNVRSISDGKNYDQLVQAVVEQCTSIDDAEQLLHDMTRANRYHWSNILVASAHQIAAFEVHDQRIAVQRDAVALVRANHHVRLGPTPQDDDIATTMTRYDMAQDGLRAANHLDDIFPILRSHTSDGVGICNHSLYQTVSSYVVHWCAGEVTLYHHTGKPCDNKAYQQIRQIA